MNVEGFIKQHITKRDESLLREDFVNLHDKLENEINGKNILVIGGAGTIGSFYIKALLKFKVKSMVVVDISENGLTELVRDLRSSDCYNIPEKFITYPVDFGSSIFEKLVEKHGPFEIVANFAAHKHVRSEKDIFSIEAMIVNNVFKTRKLLDLLLENPPEHFFCVSTDKAANPVNIMGASKKLMEELLISYSDKISITTARFANVAFSNGSLLAGFLERLNKNQAWSCPLNIKRFFVSPIESGELCLLASVMGKSGEIIFPKLDSRKDMIPFDQIARDLAKYLNLNLIECVSEGEARGLSSNISKIGVNKQTSFSNQQAIYFFESDTTGEKPYEEFYTDKEELDENRFIKLGVVKNTKKRKKEEIDEIFIRLESLFNSNNYTKTDIVEALKEYLPGFDHLETGKGLDSKM